jgi:uncharacterized membrane protein
MTLPLGILDAIAVALFLGAWLAHHFFSERRSNGLNSAMARRRRDWMERMAERDARMPDSITNQGLQNGAAFFASTSLLAVGGALAALRSSNEAVQIFAALPFGIATTPQLYDLKVLGFAGIFVYAFFKFVWAYRLFNYGSILIVCTPLANQAGTPEMAIAIERAARMNVAAGKHFNRGLRTLFFALAYLGWFVSPTLLMVTTAAVVVVLWRRQFASEPLAAAMYGE